ncbi:MAG TPA: DJ-1/PfpI family protein [Acidimicrobiales bacterium]|nr:DJ-1/PfpI family protein [Acidimicrobiales bacterium]
MQIAIGLFPGFTALDAIGPYQVFTQLPDTEVVLCAAEEGVVSDDNGLLRLGVSHSFDAVDSPDIVVVPGGFITRRLARDGDPIVDWVARVHPRTTYTTSVCTGALLLGAAGLLDGLEATTHWFAYDELAKYGATPTEQRVVGRGKIWTAAGVSAGIDRSGASRDVTAPDWPGGRGATRGSRQCRPGVEGRWARPAAVEPAFELDPPIPVRLAGQRVRGCLRARRYPGRRPRAPGVHRR